MFADLSEGCDTFIELFACMGSAYLDADTSLTFGHNGIIETGDVDTFFLQFGRKSLAEHRVIEHDGADSRLRGFDIETCRFHAIDEVCGVLVEPILRWSA